MDFVATLTMIKMMTLRHLNWMLWSMLQVLVTVGKSMIVVLIRNQAFILAVSTRHVLLGHTSNVMLSIERCSSLATQLSILIPILMHVITTLVVVIWVVIVNVYVQLYQHMQKHVMHRGFTLNGDHNNYVLFNVSSVKNIKLVAPQILARVETYVLYSQNFLSSVSKAVFARMIQFYIMVNVLNKRSVLAIMTTWNINQDPLLLSTVKNALAKMVVFNVQGRHVPQLLYHQLQRLEAHHLRHLRLKL